MKENKWHKVLVKCRECHEELGITERKIKNGEILLRNPIPRCNEHPSALLELLNLTEIKQFGYKEKEVY